MKRICALLLCLGLALCLGCAGAEENPALTPEQEARAIALAAGLTGLSQEQAAALTVAKETFAWGEDYCFHCPQEPAYALLSQLTFGISPQGVLSFSQPLSSSEEPIQYASAEEEHERLAKFFDTVLPGLYQEPGADYSRIQQPEEILNGDTGERFPFRRQECFFVFKPASAHPLAGTIVRLDYCPEYAQLFTLNVYPLD